MGRWIDRHGLVVKGARAVDAEFDGQFVLPIRVFDTNRVVKRALEALLAKENGSARRIARRITIIEESQVIFVELTDDAAELIVIVVAVGSML